MDALNKEIIYFLPDSDAGVASIVRNLLKYKPNSDIVYKVIFYHKKNRKKNRIQDKYNVNKQIHFEFSKTENLYAIFRRLKKFISSENSVLVANDIMALRLVNALKLKNPLVYIIHGDFDYYYKIAKNYQNEIDLFIAYSKFTAQQLTEKLDLQNKNKVKLLYYPTPDIKNFQKKQNKKLQLVFVGSFIERKGVQYLKKIYNKLTEKKINFDLKIIGSGEKEIYLKKQFENIKNTYFLGQLKNSKILTILKTSDILIFPSLSEGLPNAVVEAMKNKCVPVAFDIKSGIPDLIENSITGFKTEPEDIDAFVGKIVYLSQNNEKLLEIAENAYKKAHNILAEKEAIQYENLFLNLQTNKNKTFKKLPVGGILNKPYLPNFLVKTIRKIINHLKL